LIRRQFAPYLESLRDADRPAVTIAAFWTGSEASDPKVSIQKNSIVTTIHIGQLERSRTGSVELDWGYPMVELYWRERWS
jgi:hypothetical protein